MHCPQCGQQQVSDAIRFCSRCGFLLTGVAEVMANKGLVPRKLGPLTGTGDSPRRRGIKKGAFLFFLAFLIVPLMALLSLALNIEPYLAVIAVIVFGGGGILRMVYALMFEYGDTKQLGFDPVANTVPAIENQMRNPALIGTPASTEAYEPPRQGTWMDTNDLTAKPPSVTDHTTKLLTKDEDQ